LSPRGESPKPAYSGALLKGYAGGRPMGLGSPSVRGGNWSPMPQNRSVGQDAGRSPSNATSRPPAEQGFGALTIATIRTGEEALPRVLTSTPGRVVPPPLLSPEDGRDAQVTQRATLGDMYLTRQQSARVVVPARHSKGDIRQRLMSTEVESKEPALLTHEGGEGSSDNADEQDDTPTAAVTAAVDQSEKGPRLFKGAKVLIGGTEVRIGKQLGEGSFGVVWAGQLADGQLVAIKQMSPPSKAAQDQVLYEVGVLGSLSAFSGDGLPKLIDYWKSEAGDNWQVVMSIVAGDPVDDWLYGTGAVAFKTMNIELIASGKPLKEDVTMDYAPAVKTAKRCLADIASYFKFFGGKVYHRDISAHNVMVNETETAEGTQLSFGVIDFGLSVDIRRWEREGWPNGLVAGDVRYWSPSHWVMYLMGSQSMTVGEGIHFKNQYCKKGDAYAVAILVLELLFGLAREDTLPPMSQQLRQAWLRHWTFVTTLFQRTWTHPQGLPGVRPELQRDQTVHHHIQSVANLRAALHVTDEPMFHTLREMLGERGEVDWREIFEEATKVRPQL